MKPLILHLKAKYYWMIKTGEKTFEYREYKPYWISRIHDQKQMIFILGYTSDNLKTDIKDISIIKFKELPEYAQKEFKSSPYPHFFKIEFEG